MIYVPTLNDTNCVVLRDSSTIRVYDVNPRANISVNYTDYYINSHYISNTGVQSFGVSVNVACRDHNDFSTAWVYRADLSSILLSFVCIMLIIIIPFSLVFKKLFRRF